MKRELYDKCVRAFEGLIRHSNGLIERVTLDVEGETVYGVLHLPEKRAGKVPAMLFFPGMDMFKEEFPNAEMQPVRAAWHRDADLDGPGQGETRVKGCAVTDEKYVKAGRAALDYLQQRPEIDGDKLAVSGASFGSYWAPLLAAADSAREGERRHHGHSLFDDADLRARAAELQIDLHVYGRDQR